MTDRNKEEKVAKTSEEGKVKEDEYSSEESSASLRALKSRRGLAGEEGSSHHRTHSHHHHTEDSPKVEHHHHSHLSKSSSVHSSLRKEDKEEKKSSKKDSEDKDKKPLKRDKSEAKLKEGEKKDKDKKDRVKDKEKEKEKQKSSPSSTPRSGKDEEKEKEKEKEKQKSLGGTDSGKPSTPSTPRRGKEKTEDNPPSPSAPKGGKDLLLPSTPRSGRSKKVEGDPSTPRAGKSGKEKKVEDDPSTPRAGGEDTPSPKQVISVAEIDDLKMPQFPHIPSVGERRATVGSSSDSSDSPGTKNNCSSRSCVNSPGRERDEDAFQSRADFPRRYSDAALAEDGNPAHSWSRSPLTPTAIPPVKIGTRRQHSRSTSVNSSTLCVTLLAPPSSSPTLQQPASTKDLGVFSFTDYRKRQSFERRSKPLTTDEPKKDQADGQDAKQQQQQQQKHVGKWQFLDVIGSGFYGCTYRGQHAETSQQVVIKELYMRQISVPHLEQMKEAYASLERLDHQNLVKLLDIVQHRKRLYTISEPVRGVSLGSVLKYHGKLSEDFAAFCCVQVLDALRYLHSFAIVHGDIHPNNVLIDTDGVIRLTDLDLKCFAERANKPVSIVSRCKSSSNVTTDRFALNSVGTSFCGHPSYTAPEVAKMEIERCPATDIWAFGCLTAELVEGVPPFHGVHPITILNNLVTGVRMPVLNDKNLSTELLSFLEACFTTPYYKRPNAHALKRLPFLAGKSRLTESEQYEKTREAYIEITKKVLAVIKKDSSKDENLFNAGLLLDLCSSEEGDAYKMASAPLISLREYTDTVKSKVCEGGESQIKEELVPILEECISSDEFLLSFFKSIKDERDTAKRERDLAQERMLIAEKHAEGLADDRRDLAQAMNVVTSNLTHLERAFRNGKEGIEKLATMLYGRLSGEAITGVCSALLDQYTPSSKKWRPTWVVLRDNFLFFFKNGAVGRPTEIILLDTAACNNARVLPSEQFPGHKYCFSVGDQILGAPNESAPRHWVNAIKHVRPWYKSESPFDSAAAASSSRRRLTIFPHKQSIGGNTPVLSPLVPAPETPPRRDSSAASPRSIPARSVFGVPLPQLAQSDPSKKDRNLPSVVDVLVGDIIARGLKEEGILRIPGSHDEIEKLKTQLNATAHALDVDLKAFDINTSAGVLKNWLRNMPHPFIPDSTEQDRILLWLDEHQQKEYDEAVGEEFKQMLLQCMPASSYAVLLRISELVLRITSFSEVNLMTMENVMTCLTPSMKVPPIIFVRFVENYQYVFNRGHDRGGGLNLGMTL